MVHAQPPGPVAGVLAFAAHHVVAADVDPAWVHERLAPGDLSAPVGPEFLGALAVELGRSADNLDVVLAAPALPGPPPVDLTESDLDEVADHPRVARASRYRTDVMVHTTGDGTGLLITGRGLAGRWEVAFEVAEVARGRGLGRALVRAARHVVPESATLFVAVAPGNVPSLRAVLADGGWVPIGAEVLFPEPDRKSVV